MEAAALKSYLSEVLGREQALFTARQVKSTIVSRIEKLSDLHEPIKPPDPPNYSSHISLHSATVAWVIGAFPILGGLISGAAGVPSGFVMALLALVICVVISVVVWSKNQAVTDEANKNLTAEYEEQKNIVKARLSSIKTKQTTLLPKLMDSQSEIDAFISETQTALDALYGLEIIFGKYRHFVAVASLCEYVQSGRCDTLEGHEGAYNIYESELRQNLIIGQLSAVIEGLQQIRDAQYMIYNAISEANQISRSIVNELNALNKGVGEVTAASAMTAYFTKEAAHNSQLLVDINRGAYGALYNKQGHFVSI